MPGEYGDLLVEQHQLQQELNELEAIESAQAQAEAAAETIDQVAKQLKEIADKVNETGGEISDYADEISSILEKLGVDHGGLKSFVDQVTEGLGDAGGKMEGVAEAFSEVDAALDKVRELIALGDKPASEILEAFGDYFGEIVDKLGPLVERIPGLGTFISIWMKAIERIAESVARIESIVERNNQIMQTVFGQDLYLTARSPRQARAERRRQIEERLAELADQIGSHPANPEYQVRQELAQFDRDRLVDIKNAVGQALKALGWSPSDLEAKISALAWSRWRLMQAWQAYRVLLARPDTIRLEIQVTRESMTSAPSTAEEALSAHTRKDSDQVRIDLLREELERHPQDVEDAKRELDRLLQDYDAALGEVERFNEHVRNTLQGILPGFMDWYRENSPSIFDEDYWSIPAIRSIRSAAAEGKAQPTQTSSVHDGGSRFTKGQVALAALALLVAAAATTVAITQDRQAAPPAAQSDADQPPFQLTSDQAYHLTLMSTAGHFVYQGFQNGNGLTSDSLPAPVMVANNVVQHSDGQKTAAPEGAVAILGHLTFGLEATEQDSQRLFGPQGVFPCGQGNYGYTVCDGGSPGAGGWVISTNVMRQDIPVLGSGLNFQFGQVFDVDGDPANNYSNTRFTADFFTGSDFWMYTANQGDSWRLFTYRVVGGNDATPINNSPGRITFQGPMVTYVIPVETLGGWPMGQRTTSFRHQGDFGQRMPWSGDQFPLVSEGLSPVMQTMIPSLPVAQGTDLPINRVTSFYDMFNSHYQERQVEGLLGTLHPKVIERYGEEPCRQTLDGTLEVAPSVEAGPVMGPFSWNWELDGVSDVIGNTYTVNINRSVGEGRVEGTTHLSLLQGGNLAWFTDCGDPR